MSFLSSDQNKELAELAARADEMTREDLVKGDVTGENDYTSAFLARLRDLIRDSAQTGFSARILKMDGGDEREIGADAAIILTVGNQSKVAVFEAKWPRFTVEGYSWDSKPKDDEKRKNKTRDKNTKASHFSNQLERQKKWAENAAVFEVFYSEHVKDATPPYLEAVGSTCLWHDDAIAHSIQRPDPKVPWSQAELSRLLRGKKVSLPSVLKVFGECKKGKPLAAKKAEVMAKDLSLPDLVLAVNVRDDGGRLQRSEQLVPPGQAKVDESIVEDAALTWFGELGYAVGHGPQMAPGEPAAERDAFGEVVLVGRLREALRRLNPAIPFTFPTLATLRDTLLPKLLSGKLSVAGSANLIQTSL